MIVAGFGFRAGATVSALRVALELAQRGHPAATTLATVEDKVADLAPLADAMGLPLMPVASTMLQRVDTPTQSPASLAARSTGSVAEAAALAAAGPGARLLTSRHISPDRMASCAIAEGVST